MMPSGRSCQKGELLRGAGRLNVPIEIQVLALSWLGGAVNGLFGNVTVVCRAAGNVLLVRVRHGPSGGGKADGCLPLGGRLIVVTLGPAERIHQPVIANRRIVGDHRGGEIAQRNRERRAWRHTGELPK